MFSPQFILFSELLGQCVLVHARVHETDIG